MLRYKRPVLLFPQSTDNTVDLKALFSQVLQSTVASATGLEPASLLLDRQVCCQLHHAPKRGKLGPYSPHNAGSLNPPTTPSATHSATKRTRNHSSGQRLTRPRLSHQRTNEPRLTSRLLHVPKSSAHASRSHTTHSIESRIHESRRRIPVTVPHATTSPGTLATRTSTISTRHSHASFLQNHEKHQTTLSLYKTRRSLQNKKRDKENERNANDRPQCPKTVMPLLTE